MIISLMEKTMQNKNSLYYKNCFNTVKKELPKSEFSQKTLVTNRRDKVGQSRNWEQSVDPLIKRLYKPV